MRSEVIVIGRSGIPRVLRVRESTPADTAPQTAPISMSLAAGMWRQHELRDGTYTLDDLLDIVELIRVRRENESRAMEARQ